jgi:thioredoxin 1
MRLLKDLLYDEVTHGEGIVVILYHAEWCAPCNRVLPLIEKFEKEFPAIQFYKVNVEDHQEFFAQAKLHHITAVPTLEIYKEGRQVDKVIGYHPEEYIRECLADAMVGAAGGR